jgi:hypothetical protein
MVQLIGSKIWQRPDLLTVTTAPVNREVRACLERYVMNGLRSFGAGSWTLRAERRVALAPTMTDAALRQALRAYASDLATDCYPAKNPPERVRIRVLARRDADQLVLEVTGGDGFRRCLAAGLRQRLRSAFSTSRQMPDGSYQRYFRIDADASASVQIEVETPAARERRRERLRRELERDKYEF